MSPLVVATLLSFSHSQKDVNWGPWRTIEGTTHKVEVREGEGPTFMAPKGAVAHYWMFRNSYPFPVEVRYRLRYTDGALNVDDSGAGQTLGPNCEDHYRGVDANEFEISSFRIIKDGTAVEQVAGPKHKAFRIVIQRAKHDKHGGIPGEIFVNGMYVGPTLERVGYEIPSGDYKGLIQYISQKGMAQGPFGSIARTGDFFLEISGVSGKSQLFFHGGTLPKHSEGCILLGAVWKDDRGNKSVYSTSSPLYKLRELFYGTDAIPISTPNVDITISIENSD